MPTTINDMLYSMQDFIALLAHYAWSPISIFLLVGTGLLMTVQLKFVQIRYLKHAFKLLIYGQNQPESNPADHKSEHKSQKLSGFQVLATVLSGTIGTGNIAGVATAIVIGGPGSLFWMWVTGFVGMATKFTSCTLAHFYRQKDANNHVLGGPMITLAHGLKYYKLAKTFAAFMILGCLSTGSMVQANSIVDGTTYLIPSLNEHRLILGMIIAFCSGIVIIGGVTRIANVATIIVPFMAFIYVGTALIILTLNYSTIPTTFRLIFEYAFSIKAISGASFWLVIRSGVARGLFASEAGLGTAPIALATLNTKNPLEAGFIGMLSPIIDTLLVCTMTGLIILSSGVYNPDSLVNATGAALSQQAFSAGFSELGDYSSLLAAWIVGISLTLFAYTTILTWAYYGDRSVSYLFGDKYIIYYRIIFSIVLVLGAILKLEVVWNIADIANIGMAVPNLISILLLRKQVINLLKSFTSRESEQSKVVLSST